MIDLGSPAIHLQGERGGILAFGDHAEPDLFHVIGDRPALRWTGDRPDLALLQYRLDSDVLGVLGGGLLSLTVHLPPDEELERELRSRLMRQYGLDAPARLAPVVPESANCELILLDRSTADDEAESSLVPRILGGGSPSGWGDQSCLFMSVLSPDAATIVEQALRQGGLPVGVVYQLEVLGLRPALRASFTAHWNQVYEFLERRHHGGALLVAVDVGPTMEELVQRELIRVHIDQLVPDAERTAVYTKVLERIQLEVISKFFKPTLGVQPVPEGGDGFVQSLRQNIMGLIGAFTFTTSIRDVDRSELKTVNYQLSVAQVEPRLLSPQGTLSDLLGDFDVDDLITRLDAAPSRQMTFDLGSGVSFERAALDRIELTVSYGDRQEDFVLTADQPSVRWEAWLDDALGPAISYRYTAHWLGEAEGPVQASSGEIVSEARVVRIDPRELLEPLSVRALLQGVAPERFPTVLVDLRLSGDVEAEATLELGTAAEASWSRRLVRGSAWLLERRLRYVRPDGRVLEQAWQPIEPGFLVVPDPQPDVLDVQVLASARFGTHVARLIVELARVGEPDAITSLTLTESEPSATWSAALGDLEGLDDDERDAARAWRYRVTVHRVDAGVDEGEWKDGSLDGRLIVGEGFDRLREVKLVLLGPPLASLDLWAVKVRFEFRDDEAGLYAEQEQLVEAPGPIAFTYPVAHPDRQAWSYQISLFGAAGTVDREAVTTSDLMAVVRLP